MMEEEETAEMEEETETLDMILMQGKLPKDAQKEVKGFLETFGTVTSHPVGENLQFLTPSSPTVGRRIMKTWGQVRFFSGEPVTLRCVSKKTFREVFFTYQEQKKQQSSWSLPNISCLNAFSNQEK